MPGRIVGLSLTDHPTHFHPRNQQFPFGQVTQLKINKLVTLAYSWLNSPTFFISNSWLHKLRPPSSPPITFTALPLTPAPVQWQGELGPSCPTFVQRTLNLGTPSHTVNTPRPEQKLGNSIASTHHQAKIYIFRYFPIFFLQSRGRSWSSRVLVWAMKFVFYRPMDLWTHRPWGCKCLRGTIKLFLKWIILMRVKLILI